MELGSWLSGAHGQAELGPGLASPVSLLCGLDIEPLSSLSMFSVPNCRWGQGWSQAAWSWTGGGGRGSPDREGNTHQLAGWAVNWPPWRKTF